MKEYINIKWKKKTKNQQLKWKISGFFGGCGFSQRATYTEQYLIETQSLSFLVGFMAWK